QSFISPEPLWDMAAILKKHRTDLRTTIREKEIMSVKTELSKDKASFFSFVQLNVTFTTDKKTFDKKNKMFGPTQPGQMTCTFGINLDLEQLLLLPAKLRETRLALNHATFALVQQKLQAKEVLASAQSSYYHTVAAYRIEAEKLKISKQKLQEVKENYRLNKKTLIDLQEEETKVYAIEMKVIEQGYKVKKAEFALYKLTGMLDR
ncbi:MAG: TolC family protein, partial [Candidatus Cardinium sp.]|nr:TolC family protein [Candidatus Cardinium sp.]